MKNILFFSSLVLLICLGNSKELRTNKSQEIYNNLKVTGIKHPEIVLAQAILETGWFSSYSFKSRKNLFGLYDSNKKDYFEFNTELECIGAYKRMIQDKYYTDTSETYYEFLDCMWEYNGECKRYAQAEDYNSKLKSIVSWINKNIEL